MKLYIYADESGTFDQINNELFVYGGVIVPGKEVKDGIERKYIAIENDIRENSSSIRSYEEIKANALPMRSRKRLYGVIESSACYQFATIVRQRFLRSSVFSDKRSKQRYLDWALKIGIKQGIAQMLNERQMRIEKVEKIAIFVDEHSSSTSGKYNLCDSINEELRIGMYDPAGRFHDPLFSPQFPEIPVSYLDSKKVTLIRAADITANWIYCAERDKEVYPFAMRRIEGHAAVYRHPR